MRRASSVVKAMQVGRPHHNNDTETRPRRPGQRAAQRCAARCVFFAPSDRTANRPGVRHRVCTSFGCREIGKGPTVTSNGPAHLGEPAMKRGNRDVVVGVFYTRSEAEQAIRDLRIAGFAEDRIGMVARDHEGRVVTEKGGETLAEEGAAAGAVVGAGAGALVGLGVLTGTIPVIGPVLAIGTLGTILLNAAGGAAILGLVGALVGLGIPEDEAKYYEDEVVAGRYLVTVEAGDRAADARGVYTRHGGYDRSTFKAAGRASNTEGDRTMQLSEEQLRANKTTEKTGEVDVR